MVRFDGDLGALEALEACLPDASAENQWITINAEILVAIRAAVLCDDAAENHERATLKVNLETLHDSLAKIRDALETITRKAIEFLGQAEPVE